MVERELFEVDFCCVIVGEIFVEDCGLRGFIFFMILNMRHENYFFYAGNLVFYFVDFL